MTVSKKAVAAALAAAIGAGAVVPAAQAATTTTTTTRTSVYHIRVNGGILAGGGNVVRAKVVVKNPDPTVRSWYSRATIRRSSARASTTRSRRPTGARATAACRCWTAA